MLEILKKLKQVKLRHLVLLIVILSFNSYAWFIYSTKVSTGMNTHVTSWNVIFKVGEEVVESNLSIDLDDIYPGMEIYEREIKVQNNGEIKAELSYEIQSITVFGNKYTINENVSAEELENMIKKEYPFKINISINEQNIEENEVQEGFKIKVEWPFESDNDELDTYWGERAYEFHSLHPDRISLQIVVKLMAIQKATT